MTIREKEDDFYRNLLKAVNNPRYTAIVEFASDQAEDYELMMEDEDIAYREYSVTTDGPKFMKLFVHMPDEDQRKLVLELVGLWLNDQPNNLMGVHSFMGETYGVYISIEDDLPLPLIFLSEKVNYLV